jgi:Ca2+-binding EF-hand superfamily protein
MRSYLLAMLVAMVPAAIAMAQIGVNSQDPAGGRPPQFDQGNPGDQGGFRRMGPPPNVMFTAIDADGDGAITKAELRKAVAALKQLDADNDGTITLAEVSPASPWGDPGQFADRIITENDKNGDGKLTADELPERMQQMLQNADPDGDGEITRDEIVASMASMRERFRGGRGRGFRGGPGGLNGGGRDGGPIGRLMQLDVDGNGLTPNEIPQDMKAMFRPTDDLDRDGVLNAAEMQAVIERMGDAARAIGAGGDPNTFRDPNRRNRPRAGDPN